MLFCSPEPVSHEDLCEAIGCAAPRLDDAVEELQALFAPQETGIVLREVAGGLTLA
ncbi:MAG: SMC-Scp complex subunit ScpB, partial [Solirubrobacterales bacterium]